jgi:zinc transport system substrate-binding protein
MNNLKQILVCLALSLVILVPAVQGAEDRFQVVVSILPQAWLVEALGGEHVEVSVLVGPGHSPATFEPTVKQLAGLQAAGLLVTAGVPFELGLMPKIKGMKDGPTLCGPEAQPGHDHHGDDHHHHHHDELDPHFWLDPLATAAHAETIRDALMRLDPDHAESYARNFAMVQTLLRKLDEDMGQILSACSGQAFFVFHPAYGHLARRFGLEQVAVETGGKDPGPRQLAGVIDKALATGARAIIVQPQFSRKTARVVADAAGLQVVELDPLNRDYLTNMRFMARTLARVLGCGEAAAHE